MLGSSFSGLDEYYELSENFFNECDLERVELQAVAKKSYQPWLYILEASTKYLYMLWGFYLRVLQRDNEDKPFNLPLARAMLSLLSSSCNYAYTVRLLVISGLDNPARGAARALDEHLCVCITILYNIELAAEFTDSQQPDEASTFWYSNFNTKKLRTHLRKIELSVGVDDEISLYFRDWRKTELDMFSQAVHPTFLSGFMAAFPRDISDFSKPTNGVFGALSVSSERTLKHACQAIGYFAVIAGKRLTEDESSPLFITKNSSDKTVFNIDKFRISIIQLLDRYMDYDIFDYSKVDEL